MKEAKEATKAKNKSQKKRVKAIRRKKPSDCQAAEKATSVPRKRVVLDLQECTPTQALRRHDEAEAKRRNKQMRIKNRNTAFTTKIGNFVERQAKETGGRSRQAPGTDPFHHMEHR